jgi:hypothetical protein
MWKKNHDIKADERFCWKEKLSTISRAYIHETEVGVPKVKPDRLPFHNKPPMQIERIPYPSKSPFARWSEPSQEQILTSLDESTVVIYTDGSTKPKPEDSVVQDLLFKTHPCLNGWSWSFPSKV